MIAHVESGCLLGVYAKPVKVEVALTRGLPGFDLVGLAEKAVKESKVRVKAAIDSQGIELPPRRFVVHLAPADLPKTEACYDVAIVVGVLVSSGSLQSTRIEKTLFLGELSLSGEVRPVRGVIPHLCAARDRGLKAAIVPFENREEAHFVEGIEVLPVSHIRQVMDWLKGKEDLSVQQDASANASPKVSPVLKNTGEEVLDFSQVKGQQTAKRALEIAAVGGHHALMLGPPGSGKSMLAKRFPGILPSPTQEEILEIASIASVAHREKHAGGKTGFELQRKSNVLSRPFRAPHSSASTPAMVGGGDPIQPGEVTLAHRGVLFLDELPEFRRDVIESLRTVMESGVSEVVRAKSRVSMPAKPMVIAAMNPCPCGYDGDAKRLCRCGPDQVFRYRSRVSGPIMDRFDLHVSVPRVRISTLTRMEPGENTEEIKARVLKARTFREKRTLAKKSRIKENSAQKDTALNLSEALIRMLEVAMEKLNMTARGFNKTIQLARTIADMSASEEIQKGHLTEALQYRLLDRQS